jgi:hypothetical protein
MVKRFEFDLYAGGMVDDDTDGRYVLHSDYAALQASHERLMRALRPFTEATLTTPTNQIIGLMREDFDNAKSAIAAAQPFKKTTDD